MSAEALGYLSSPHDVQPSKALRPWRVGTYRRTAIHASGGTGGRPTCGRQARL